jgi:hypothetical protein
MRKAYSRPRGTLVALGLAALLLGAAACGDTDERPVSWSYISATIIQPNCATSRCHSKGANVLNLTLDGLDAYDRIKPYATPGDSGIDGTTLMERLNGGFGSIVVQRMPVDEPLPAADIALIRAWILAGAPNN